MSVPAPPQPAMLFLSVLASDWNSWPELLDALTGRFGPLESLSEPIAFTETSYYDHELGTPIHRRAMGFERLVEQDALPDLKHAANELERRYQRPDGGRTFNLDPGLLTGERLVLATGKNFSHRVYLGRGIFADLTLVYRRGVWQVLPWTFPDYAGKRLQDELTALREMYKQRISRRSTQPESEDGPP